MTIQEFADSHGLTLYTEPTDHNPNMSDDMDHWKCRIRNDAGQTMTIIFSKGLGHNGKKPEIDEVLDCIASDYTTELFETWASEYGYDTDSRSAERTWKACIKQSNRALRFLGQDALNQLLDCERL